MEENCLLLFDSRWCLSLKRVNMWMGYSMWITTKAGSCMSFTHGHRKRSEDKGKTNIEWKKWDREKKPTESLIFQTINWTHIFKQWPTIENFINKLNWIKILTFKHIRWKKTHTFSLLFLWNGYLLAGKTVSKSINWRRVFCTGKLIWAYFYIGARW